MHDDWSTCLLVGLVWFCLVLHRLPHRHWIQREKWEVATDPLCAAVLCRRLKKVISWPALLWSSRVLASTQCLRPMVAVLQNATWRELVVLASTELERGPVAVSHGQQKSHHGQPPASISYTLTSSTSPEVLGIGAVSSSGVRMHGWKAWFEVWNDERKNRDLPKCCVRALLLFAPVLVVVQTYHLCFIWSWSRVPSSSEEHILLYASIFLISFRHPCGSVLILPLKKIEIFISSSIFEELRFLSPWIIWLSLCYAAFAASLLYNHHCSQYSIIQPHSGL